MRSKTVDGVTTLFHYDAAGRLIAECAFFESTASNSRFNFLELLRIPNTDYRLNDDAWQYLREYKLPQTPCELLCAGPAVLDHRQQWQAHLDALVFG